ncbi:MAG: carbohydrate binding family 9 domain-containing protein, partial [Gemmatimonadota bacterium]|nr:carbohydrate binding family 9 domain-containing protein [Gemmatimonadota bacterium]
MKLGGRIVVLLPLLMLGMVARGASAPLLAQSTSAEGGSRVEDAVDLDGRPIVRASVRPGAVRLDGHLDEAAWSEATAVSGFRQVDPEEGEPVSERTEARVLFDAEALYVGVRFYDREPVSTRLGRRDMALSDSDWLGVVIDSYHDHRTAFSFDVNPSGVQRDAIKSVDANGNETDDLSWDGVWEAETSIDEEGWSAEYRIPFSQLRFASTDEPLWGIQIERVIGRRREYAVLAFTPKAERGGIATYGHLTGLGGIEASDRLEVLPYVVTRAEYVEPGTNPYRSDSEYFGSAGVDLLYRPSSQLTLNATINPDFGQVEVDPAIVNLTVYETRYEEKRPFFIEGSEIFDFGRNTSGGQLFYSRRIGRSPQLSPPSREADVPEITTILGAGKLTGKTEGGWSIGIMEAVTAEESARYLDTGGATAETPVEPLTNYLVTRVRKDGMDGRSSIGAMFTAANRDLGTEALRAGLRESGYAGGIDFRREWADRAWVLQGSAVLSRVAGSQEAIARVQAAGNHFFQRPDADHLTYDPTVT